MKTETAPADMTPEDVGRTVARIVEGLDLDLRRQVLGADARLELALAVAAAATHGLLDAATRSPPPVPPEGVTNEWLRAVVGPLPFSYPQPCED